MAGHVQQSIEQQQAFVADASHQLRNPLAALLLRMEDLASRVPGELRGDATLALSEARRLVDILERLLELARSDHAELQVTECDIVALLEQRLRAWRSIAEARRIRFSVVATPRLRVRTDEAALAEIIDVVLDNALKFSPDGARVELVASLSEPAPGRESPDPQRTAVIAIRDYGPGLTADELTRIGNRFWRGGGRQNVAGYGLGLSIARALLGRLGASMHFTSPTGGGLAVEIRLPTAS
jgi:signal transduction histidine kinase